MNQKQKEELNKIISQNLHGGKLPCKIAFQISEETGISLDKIGSFANEVKIKISNCQLNCFK